MNSTTSESAFYPSKSKALEVNADMGGDACVVVVTVKPEPLLWKPKETHLLIFAHEYNHDLGTAMRGVAPAYEVLVIGWAQVWWLQGQRVSGTSAPLWFAAYQMAPHIWHAPQTSHCPHYYNKHVAHKKPSKSGRRPYRRCLGIRYAMLRVAEHGLGRRLEKILFLCEQPRPHHASKTKS